MAYANAWGVTGLHTYTTKSFSRKVFSTRKEVIDMRDENMKTIVADMFMRLSKSTNPGDRDLMSDLQG